MSFDTFLAKKKFTVLFFYSVSDASRCEYDECVAFFHQHTKKFKKKNDRKWETISTIHMCFCRMAKCFLFLLFGLAWPSLCAIRRKRFIWSLSRQCSWNTSKIAYMHLHTWDIVIFGLLLWNSHFVRTQFAVLHQHKKKHICSISNVDRWYKKKKKVFIKCI